jgi:hypothetical protein
MKRLRKQFVVNVETVTQEEYLVTAADETEAMLLAQEGVYDSRIDEYTYRDVKEAIELDTESPVFAGDGDGG